MGEIRPIRILVTFALVGISIIVRLNRHRLWDNNSDGPQVSPPPYVPVVDDAAPTSPPTSPPAPAPSPSPVGKTTDDVLKTIRAAGYSVRVVQLADAVEMTAAPRANPSNVSTARVPRAGASAAVVDYRCACELARAIGL